MKEITTLLLIFTMLLSLVTLCASVTSKQKLSNYLNLSAKESTNTQLEKKTATFSGYLTEQSNLPNHVIAKENLPQVNKTHKAELSQHTKVAEP